jgi:predicted transcriptional regulator
MPKPAPHLSRREQQIMEALYRSGSASAAAVRAGIPAAPSYSAVRALLKILETKGHVRHRAEAGKYIYTPTRPHDAAARSALHRLVETFFAGSPERAVAALLDAPDSQLSPAELDRLATLIADARKEGR